MMEPLAAARVMHFCRTAIFPAEKRAAQMAALQSFRKATATDVQKQPGVGNAGLKSGIRDLADMSGDEFSHLEHTDLALAVKYRPESVVRIDHGSLFLVLTTVLLDVVPKFLGEFRTRERFRTDDCSKFIIGLDRPHEGGVRLALGRSLSFRHKG
jgi:hypothetical protein